MLTLELEYTVEEAIDQIGFGRFQVKISLITAALSVSLHESILQVLSFHHVSWNKINESFNKV